MSRICDGCENTSDYCYPGIAELTRERDALKAEVNRHSQRATHAIQDKTELLERIGRLQENAQKLSKQHAEYASWAEERFREHDRKIQLLGDVARKLEEARAILSEVLR